MKRLLSVLVTLLLVLGTLTPYYAENTALDTKDAYQAFYGYVDTAYSLRVTETLQAFGTNDTYGFRTAGSPAELAAGDYLAEEMKAIGLSNVYKDEVPTDTWVFNNASILFTDVDGEEQDMPLAAFHVTYVAENEPIELVYAGKGTEADYEGLDVTGKLVLVDIDQYNEWWVNWPAYQAKVKGAAAVIVINVDGYCTYSEDTVGVQDLCGPEDAPVFSVSVNQGNALKDAIAHAGGSLPVLFTADTQVERDGVSYNIIGEIPGMTDEVIYLIGHYDSYFRAFGDNTSGIGGIMGIARALILSGYQPQKTIRIVLHCAEEWGIADSRYDWAWGATASAQKHPEWAENAFLLFNIDGGLINGTAKGHRLTTSYELASAVKAIGDAVEGSPLPEEIKTRSPLWTWTEEFAYAQMGIPTIASGMHGTVNSDGTYHSSSDTMEGNHYNDAYYAFSQKLYGTYLIAFDNMLTRPLQYGDLFTAMADSIPDWMPNYDDLTAALLDAAEAGLAFAQKAETLSADDAVAFNNQVNQLYALIQKNLFTLDWNEEYQFVHAHKQTNVEMLEAAIAALEDGDAALALDEYLWAIDMNWYAYAFDRTTYDYFVLQVLGADARNGWGEGFVTSHTDLFDVIRELMDKQEGDDLSAEIALLTAELEVQKAELYNVTEKEVQDILAITQMMRILSE